AHAAVRSRAGRPLEAQMIPFDVEARRLVTRAARRLLYDPASGVIQVGLGMPERGGSRQASLALRFHVVRKRSPRELSAAGVTPVPRELLGLPTDVLEGRYLPQIG